MLFCTVLGPSYKLRPETDSTSFLSQQNRSDYCDIKTFSKRIWDFQRNVSRKAQCKYFNIRTLLTGADTSIMVTGLPFTYTGMHFLHQSKFTMQRPITMNILPSHINGVLFKSTAADYDRYIAPSSNENSLDGIGFQTGTVLGTEVINGRTNISGLKSYDKH